jgi:putative phosphoribosyl transferase
MFGHYQVFQNRQEAGRLLAERLQARPWTNPLVMALPRGGVPVAYEVAQALHAPLELMIVRKLGHPLHPEYAIGAMASGGVVVMNPGERIPAVVVEKIVERERAELARREALYRGGAPAPEIRGHEIILVDDGLATGATMSAAVAALRQLAPAKVVVAVPVGSPESVAMLRRHTDELVCLQEPEGFRAVGEWYRDFSQTSDEEVTQLLEQARRDLSVASR